MSCRVDTIAFGPDEGSSMKIFKNLFNRKHEIDGAEKMATYLEEAIAEFEDGDYANAAHHFTLIVNAFPDHPLAFLMLGRTLIELNDLPNAVNALFKHLAIDPGSIEAMILLGLAEFESGQIEAAKERFEQALNLKHDSILAMENLTMTHFQEGRLELALQELETLHKDEPENCEILHFLVIVHGKLGNWDSAKEYVRQESVLKEAGKACDETEK